MPGRPLSKILSTNFAMLSSTSWRKQPYLTPSQHSLGHVHLLSWVQCGQCPLLQQNSSNLHGTLFVCTLEPVYNGHCISRLTARGLGPKWPLVYISTCASRSPLYNSHPEGDHCRQVPLYHSNAVSHHWRIDASSCCEAIFNALSFTYLDVCTFTW